MGWLITLAVLAALAWLPLGATARYDSDGVVLKIIAGPARIQLLPKKKGEKKEKTEKKKASAKKKATAPQKETAEKKEKGGPITDFLPLVKTVLDLLNAFRKKLFLLENKSFCQHNISPKITDNIKSKQGFIKAFGLLYITHYK